MQNQHQLQDAFGLSLNTSCEAMQHCTLHCFVQASLKQAEEVQGTPLAEFGLVSSLPQEWWSVFPFKRRQHL